MPGSTRSLWSTMSVRAQKSITLIDGLAYQLVAYFCIAMAP